MLDRVLFLGAASAASSKRGTTLTPATITTTAVIKTANLVVAIIGDIVVKNYPLFEILMIFTIIWKETPLYFNYKEEKFQSSNTPISRSALLLPALLVLVL
jgi:hypothetical protein